MKKLVKNVVLCICLIFVLFGCSNPRNTYSRKSLNSNTSEIIVPIKLPKLPYLLKRDVKSVSWNNINRKVELDAKVKINKLSSIGETEIRKGSNDHKMEGQYYYEELWDKYSVVAADNSDSVDTYDYENGETNQAIGAGQSIEYFGENELYGVCEIVKFNNQIKTSDKKRCSGYLYFQIKVTKKGRIYHKPTFKIKNNDGLVMSIFMEKWPDLYNLNENEIIEGNILISNQEYSDTYVLTI